MAGLLRSLKTFDIERKVDNCGKNRLKKAFSLGKGIILNSYLPFVFSCLLCYGSFVKSFLNSKENPSFYK